MKKLLSTLLCIVMVVAFMPAMAFAYSVDDGKPVQRFDKDGNLQETAYTMEDVFAFAEDGDTIKLVGDAIMNNRVNLDKKIMIEGNNYTIKVASNYQGKNILFNVGEESTLTMNNVTIDAHYNEWPCYGGKLNLIAVYSGGRVECNGCTFKNNYGSAVSLEESLGAVSEAVLTNCEITGNEGYGHYYDGSGEIAGGEWVILNHAAVTVGQGGKCTIDGGSIHHNTGLVAPAIFVHSDGEAVIKGDAKIHNNTATKWGSAIGVVGHGKVTMESGEIKDNTAAEHGGAIKVENYESWGEGTATPGAGPATFIMNGGTISGNKAKESTGGIHAFNFSNSMQKAVIEINGGTITGNTVENANQTGSAACIREGAVLKLSGSPSIEGKVYVNNGHDDADGNTVFSEPAIEAADSFAPVKPIELDVYDVKKEVKAVEYPAGVEAGPAHFNLNVGEKWGYYWTLNKSATESNALVFWPQRHINFNDGETKIDSLQQLVNVGEKVVEPDTNLPSKPGFVIEGWYKDKALSEKWDFAKDVVPEEEFDLDLYVKWEKYTPPVVIPPVKVEIKVEEQQNGKVTSEVGPSVSFGSDVTYKITPEKGYVIKDVIVDGKSVGAVSEYTFKNVREAHTIKAVFERDLSFLDEIKLQARSRLIKKKKVAVRWKAIRGSLEGLEGYEVFRSLKFNSGYGKKPFFETKKTTYTNNKNLKKGKRYYYRVRGYVTIDGVRHYTKWSLRAWQTIPRKKK